MSKDMSEEASTDYIQARIIGKTNVRIKRLNSDTSWKETVYAINWFDAPQLQLYNFYNFLASRSVNQVGGVPLFKGKLIARQHGSDEDQREVLLLVRYPSPEQFKSMLTNTYFKCVSVLRSLAVKRFTFCLSHSVQGPDIPKDRKKNENYGVHHFRGDLNALELIQSSLEQSSVAVVFSSLKTHELFTVNGNNTPEPVPVIMDGIVLFECENEKMLNDIVNTDQYQKGIQQSQSSYIGLYQRIL